MSEYFDLTFFLHKEKEKMRQSKNLFLELLGLEEGKNKTTKHQYPLFVGKEILFLEFEYEDVDFLQYTVCLSDFVFTTKNFDTKINQLLEVVALCFSQVKAISFATGIYEWTYHCIEGISSIKDFDTSIFSKFPILFFRKGYEQSFQPSYFHHDISCVINSGKNTQNIIASPISELMEDEGVSFDKAHIQLYGYDFAEEYAKQFGMSLAEARKVLSS